MGCGMANDLYEYPADHVGRKTYVSVRGHSKSIPKYKTYQGSDRRNYLLPEYGGEGYTGPASVAYYIPDKEAYFSPLDRTEVAGRRAHRDHMLRHDVVEAGDYRIGQYEGIERAPMPSVRESFERAKQELNR